jgi:hypothetical protein
MQSIAKRGLIWMLAVALVVAGLPMAHAMPNARFLDETTAMHAAMQQHADMAIGTPDHAHHHDGMAMDAMSDEGGDQPASSAPCKCLNCSMCVASAMASPVRFANPERRIAIVVYRLDAAGTAGIAVRVDPGIPIRDL